MAYTKYSLTPADNNAAPPNGAPEGMLPSAVNDTMRDMMSQIRDAGDGIRGGTYTMTAPVITGGSISGATGSFSTLAASGVATFSAGTVSLPSITTTGDTNTGIYFPAADTIAFTEGGTESMRITSSGQLLIGTSTAKNASAKLYINLPQTTPTTDGVGFNLDVIDGTNYDNQSGAFIQGDGNILLAQNDASGGNGFYTTFFYNGSIIGAITGNGGTGIIYSTTSDYRLKENIAPMQGALDKVVALQPVTYTWKKNGSNGQGFIAHELQAVVPECVIGEKDAVDANGKPVYQGIDTSFLVATLTAAIQELKAEVDSVKAELATLKA